MDCHLVEDCEPLYGIALVFSFYMNIMDRSRLILYMVKSFNYYSNFIY